MIFVDLSKSRKTDNDFHLRVIYRREEKTIIYHIHLKTAPFLYSSLYIGRNTSNGKKEHFLHAPIYTSCF